ncbi:50S ribosomal protein L29 [Candidatus Acetothermia bacterium]|jgi:large subunit ribosomal protein L29|nr:50S ribosomal protein L29 [Candidatus Acetothermia bacterium]MCI2426409.1 50S ribosomal protein L29 [Candidatus Acetothermia bacterium]MCI2427603.1 50S ribosomal protein L29 [Candidatus Acetothermia bacterium]MCI2428215.1 50S ribosomal protein L29 [Candidatus Acetothermia bacterium]
MKASELREMTTDELFQKAGELKRKGFNLRFQKATGELDNTAEIIKTKRDIARVMTIIRERSITDRPK